MFIIFFDAFHISFHIVLKLEIHCTKACSVSRKIYFSRYSLSGWMYQIALASIVTDIEVSLVGLEEYTSAFDLMLPPNFWLVESERVPSMMLADIDDKLN